MKTILVTGSSGMIGTRLCESLLRDGYDVIGVDKASNRWSPEIGARTVVGDLCRSRTLAGLPSVCDVVVHLAANARVHNLVLDPSLAFENMHSTFAVLEFCRTRSIPRLLFASSREVYGNTPSATHHENDARLHHCESSYTASKMSGEALAAAYGRCYGMQCVIVRFSNVYGMYDVSDRIVPLFIQRARQGRDLVVFGPEKTLDFTYIDDAVAGIRHCLRRYDDAAGRTMNIASGQGTRITHVAERVKQALDSASRIVLGENRTGEVEQFVADISAARRHLGYEPQVDIEEGLSRAIAWYSACEDPDWVRGTLGPAKPAADCSRRQSRGVIGA